MAIFSIDVWAKKAGHDLAEATLAIKLELFGGIIGDTRVLTGRARGNWQTTNDNPASGEIERTDKYTGVATDEAAKMVTADGLDILVNNLPYIEVLEEMDGMVARNMARVETNVRLNT